MSVGHMDVGSQPLLNLIRQDLGVSEFKTNLIATITQVGCVLGLLFIVPLGDLYQRKHIIIVNFSLLIGSLLFMASSADIRLVWVASLVTGVWSCLAFKMAQAPFYAEC